jgi:S1-C subfamily serine protease
MARVATPPAVGTPGEATDSLPPRPEKPRLRPPSRRTAATVLLVLLAVLAAAAISIRRDGPAPITSGDVNRIAQQRVDSALEAERAAAPDAGRAYRAIVPSLVRITASGTTEDGSADGSGDAGAGVVIRSDGTVLTALHVVQGARTITVTFADGTQSSARVAAQQPKNDIAVLTVERLPEVVVPAVLGGGPQVGDAVFAVGHPLGLNHTLTAGVVSATGRTVRVDADHSLADLIQFDAAVNPGNSGGPLLNRDGQVIGIVTGLANPSDQAFFVGIGFAVPIATAGGAAGGPSQ